MSWTAEDKPIPEDDLIRAAHPLNCKVAEEKTYSEALRMVGAKRSKYALVDLVNWLLVRNDRWKRAAKESRSAESRSITRVRKEIAKNLDDDDGSPLNDHAKGWNAGLKHILSVLNAKEFVLRKKK